MGQAREETPSKRAGLLRRRLRSALSSEADGPIAGSRGYLPGVIQSELCTRQTFAACSGQRQLTGAMQLYWSKSSIGPRAAGSYKALLCLSSTHQVATAP